MPLSALCGRGRHMFSSSDANLFEKNSLGGSGVGPRIEKVQGVSQKTCTSSGVPCTHQREGERVEGSDPRSGSEFLRAFQNVRKNG